MSTLRANALEGVDAKNSITIVAGAGNVTTTNVQEGLCKAWVFGGEDASLNDSFNISSGNDNGTGLYTYLFTNNLTDINYSGACCAHDNSDRNVTILTSVTGMYTVEVFQQNGSEIDTRNRSLIVGDLA